MDIDALRQYCLRLPHVTENMQWGDNLCLKVGGKLFAIASLDASPLRLSFKVSPENFVELCEREDIRPAPYLARASWVALEHLGAVPDSELRDLLAEAHRLVFEGLPKGKRAELDRAERHNSNKRGAPKRKAPQSISSKAKRKASPKSK